MQIGLNKIVNTMGGDSGFAIRAWSIDNLYLCVSKQK
jgi:hypothetical protein